MPTLTKEAPTKKKAAPPARAKAPPSAPVVLRDAEALNKARQPITESWVGRVPQLKPGNYADNMPIPRARVHLLQAHLAAEQVPLARKLLRFWQGF